MDEKPIQDKLITFFTTLLQVQSVFVYWAISFYLAEGAGFEPAESFSRTQRFSRPPP